MEVIWTKEQCAALKKYLDAGLSYSEIAAKINAEFKTSYSRNATIGRAKRTGLSNEVRKPRAVSAIAPRSSKSRARERSTITRPIPEPAQSQEEIKLRCADVSPRNVLLVDLKPNDCRYPYGESAGYIVFCGHPQKTGSSYCTAHFHLCRGTGTPSERAAHQVSAKHLVTA